MYGKKKVLGRGISALIEGAEGAHEDKGRYIVATLEDISPNPFQPRRTFTEESLKELSDSIREKGVIEPLLVRRSALGFELVAGERRLRAARIAGLKEVPCVLMHATDEESLELAIIENIQREDLNAIEEADAYKTLMGFGLSQEDVARKVGKDRATVANFLRLLKLPEEVKAELASGALTMGHARAILALPTHQAQRELAKKVIRLGLTVRKTEHMASMPAAPKARKRLSRFHALEEELRRIFGTKIIIKERNSKGRVEIEYYSEEERERIVELLRTLA